MKTKAIGLLLLLGLTLPLTACELGGGEGSEGVEETTGEGEGEGEEEEED
jgi:hypothetical protein